MPTAICLLPVVPVRKEPAHRSEMVSQLLFGEYVQTVEEKDDFLFVRCDYDGYDGWVQAKQLTPADESLKLQTNRYTSAFATPVARGGSLLQVPYGSPVFGGDNFSFTTGSIEFSYLLNPQQVWNAEHLQLTEPDLTALYQPYLNAPYLWGGKSVFGTDCSGFVQQVFKLLGTKLPRDAYQQAACGQAVASAAEASLGDLAFFQNEGGRVTHVGIVLNESKIVHAAGQVRIDALNDKGIIVSESGKQSHVLHSIRTLPDRERL